MIAEGGDPPFFLLPLPLGEGFSAAVDGDAEDDNSSGDEAMRGLDTPLPTLP